MAEKRVSGRRRATEKKQKPKTAESFTTEKDDIYEDFLAKYGPDLRRRSTRTVIDPTRRIDASERARELSEEARCREIDPHTTLNPAVQRQILTKRSRRILADDTGFKAMSYNGRFELCPEMPRLQEGEGEIAEEGFLPDGVPGQQTMADLVAAAHREDSVSVPIESKIDDVTDPFGNAYKEIRKSGVQIGKSEKLRAIARTAADDGDMSPDSQLVFPTFDPLFKFPESSEKENQVKEKGRKKRRKKDSAPVEQSFDIDEKDIVTSREAAVEEKEEVSDGDKKRRESRLFELLRENDDRGEREPPFEAAEKSELRDVLAKLGKTEKVNLVKCGLVALLGIILFVVSLVFDSSDTGLRESPGAYSAVCFIFILLSGGICFKELRDGIKDIRRLSFSQNSGAVLIVFAALIQVIFSFFTANYFPGRVRLLAPAAVLSLLWVLVPKLFLCSNSALAVSLVAGKKEVSVFRRASEGGIEGAVTQRLAPGGGGVRYFSGAAFLTGMMKRLTNAVPAPFAANGSYILLLLVALVAGVAGAVFSGSLMEGASAFSAAVIACLPVTYSAAAAWLLLDTNKKLKGRDSSVLTYSAAREIGKTEAVIFDVSQIVEQSACSIHGIKTYGRTDPQMAVLLCAAAINGGGSPLEAIMKQVTDQSGEIVPQAERAEAFPGEGIAAYARHSLLLLGTREFLEKNKVYVPDEDFEARFVSGDRKLLYFSVNGEFTMLLTVSYHIRRSVSAFFKYLTERKITVMINSSDPNINAGYIAKKCRINPEYVTDPDPAEAAYFSDRSQKCETAEPADIFTDGKIGSLSMVMRRCSRLTKAASRLPFVIYLLSVVSALFIVAPIFMGSIFTVSNAYIIVIRILCLAVALVASVAGRE